MLLFFNVIWSSHDLMLGALLSNVYSNFFWVLENFYFLIHIFQQKISVLLLQCPPGLLRFNQTLGLCRATISFNLALVHSESSWLRTTHRPPEQYWASTQRDSAGVCVAEHPYNSLHDPASPQVESLVFINFIIHF